MPQPSISETEIVNRALVRLGASRIQDIGNMSDPKTAQAATLYYEARDALLRACRWNFARKFVSLAQLSAAPLGLSLGPDPDYAGTIIYTGAYQLPSDYLRLSAVSPASSHWRIVGTSLYTDAPQALTSATLIGLQPANADGAANQPTTSATGSVVPIGIEYIAQIADATKFDPLFARCLSLRVALELSFTITAIENLRQAIGADFKESFAEARAIAGMEQWPEQLFDNVMVDVRYGYSNSAGAGSGIFS